MKNEEIIAEIAVTIYGEEAVTSMLENGEDIPLHTLKGWNKRGSYRIKKGEHGIQTRLWKKRKKKSSQDREQAGDVPGDEFYLAKAFLFRADQVERYEESML